MQGARNAATETVQVVRRGSEYRATPQTPSAAIFKTASYPNQLRWRKLWLALAFAQAGSVMYLSLTTRPHHVLGFVGGDKIEHVLAFFMLTFWFGQLYANGSSRKRIALAFMLAAAALEIWQRQIGGFVDLEYGDIAASFSGVILGLILLATRLSALLAGIEESVRQWQGNIITTRKVGGHI